MSALYRGNYKKGEIEILESCCVFQNKYISIYNDEVKFPQGNDGSYIRISNPQPYSVAILPLMNDGRVLLIKNFRHGVRGWGYEIPKGGIEKNETPEQAALRELREETGYDSKNLICMGCYSESPAIFSGLMYYYIALDCVKMSEQQIENTEAISGVYEFDTEEYLNGGNDELDFRDAVTELLILKYKNWRSKRDEQCLSW